MSPAGPLPAARPLARIALRRIASPAAAPPVPAWKALDDLASLVGLPPLGPQGAAA